MSLSSTSNSSGTFTSNSSLNSTPSIDRYAALKDLDEQIRENKEKAELALVTSTQQQQQQQLNATQVNPFKTNNPFKVQQQQHQQQQQQHSHLQHQVPHQSQMNANWNQDHLFAGQNGNFGQQFKPNGINNQHHPTNGGFNSEYSMPQSAVLMNKNNFMFATQNIAQGNPFSNVSF